MSENLQTHDVNTCGCSNCRAIRKYRMKGFTGPTITGAFGEVIDATPYVGVKPPGHDKSFILDSIEKLIIQPKPGHKYIWRKREDQMTYGLVETGQIRPVLMDEINREDKRSARIFPFPGPKDGEGKTLYYYATMGGMGLFEAPPQFVEDYYTAPERYAMSKLINASDNYNEAWADEVARKTGRKGEAHIEIRDRVPAVQERRGR